MRDYLVGALLFPALFGVWLLADHFYRRFHLRHPELPPPMAGRCGGECGCSGGGCGRSTDSPGNPHKPVDEE